MWKTHPVFTDYQANEFGEIRCLNYGKKHNNVQIVKQTEQDSGYLFFNVREKQYFSHRFVWECFYGLLPPKICIDHINTDRLDNRIENLRACDFFHNMENELTIKHLREAKAKQCGKKVLKLDKHTGEILGWYPSIAEATRANKISCTNYIRWCCEGREGYYTAGGFKWKYTEDCYTCKWGKWWVTECETDYEPENLKPEPSKNYAKYNNTVLWQCPGSSAKTSNFIIVPADCIDDVVCRLKELFDKETDKKVKKKLRYALKHKERWEEHNIVAFL